MWHSINFCRWQMLQTTACGFGGLALADMLRTASGSQGVRLQGMVPKARRVIFLIMAGGGVKGDFTWGETNHLGYNIINVKVHIHALHATMLRLLGIDHTRLTFNQVVRDFRLTDVHGSVVKEILA